ncbi:MAG: ABC transporter ATP-binding protein/permease [Oscillospiraceae bacterium]|nr:ABC transporter ATP-binding protein/permease [Oscillospiraceae bacterium]
MQQIKQSLRGHTDKLILAPLFKLLEAIFELMVPLIIARIINVGIAAGDTGFILVQGGWLLGLAVLGILAAVIGQHYAAQAAADVGRVLRSRLWARTMALSYEQAEAAGRGKLIHLITGDVTQIQHGLNMLLRLGVRVPLLAVGSVVMALWLNPRIGLIFLVTVIALGLSLWLVIRRILPGFGEIQAEQDELSRLGREHLAGVRVIRAFNRQASEAKAFDRVATGLTRKLMRVGRMIALLPPLASLFIHGAVLGIVWLGARHTYAGLSNPGEIIALVSYMGITLLSIMVAVHLTIIFTRALASMRRVEAVLELTPSIVDGPGAVFDADAPVLEFDGVSFAYHMGARSALADISFTLRAGETLGVIGGTGSGKTTLAGLILRFTDAAAGEVRVGGAAVGAYTLRDLRGRLGYVPQKAALFTGSVAHNLRMAAPDAAEEELWAALEIAQAAEFVRALPEGIDTEISQGGVSLSGGQRQRLNIARAIVRRPAMLVLDDASSALDYITDAALGRALRDWAEGTAVVLISQRAASLRLADRILVLEDGAAVGLGTHGELIERCAVYREICRSQGLCS